MGISGRTINFNVLMEVSERNVRRDADSWRIGYPVDNYTRQRITLVPGTPFTIEKPTTFLYLNSNADNGKIVLDFVRSAVTTTLALNKIMFLTDMSDVTSLVVRHTGSNGDPALNLNIVKG